jgi:HAD superfamily hydrolase (TIGR01484 family)
MTPAILTPTILLATDLDRTLLPNGAQPESPLARPLFTRLATRPEIRLAYVTGRHPALVEAAIAEYALPRPAFVIADVGASIYRLDADTWQPRQDWVDAIAPAWHGLDRAHLAALLQDISDLRLQEASKQGVFKLSYYAAPLDDPSDLLQRVRDRLVSSGAEVNLIWSIDETSATGLLDILPAAAGKLHALEFLRAGLGIPLHQTLFAGDSGNDMEVLVSDIPAVLVANAPDTVRAEAAARANPAALYLAVGGLFGMNGNYSAGILEGLLHFMPESRTWLVPATVQTLI